jgi:Undecaprenyl-phosphate glucose phosphotransferase
MKMKTGDILSATQLDLSSFDAKLNRKQQREQLKSTISNSTYIAPNVVTAIIRLSEIALIFGLALGCAYRYPGFATETQFGFYVEVSAAITFAILVAFELAAAYKMPTLLMPVQKMAQLILIWTLVFAAALAIVFIFKAGESLSRVWLVTWATSGLFLQIAFRQFMSACLRHLNRDGQFSRRALIVGGGENAAKAITTLQESQYTGIKLIGMFDDRDDKRSTDKFKDIHKLGNIDELIDFVRATQVDTLIITLPVTAEDRLLQILNRLWVLPVTIRLSAAEQKLHYRPRAYTYVGSLPCLDVFDQPLGDWGPMLKFCLDLVVAFVAIILLSPVLLAVAAAVKFTSKGPVLFKQMRYGFNNELIEIYKFRSMYTEQADINASKLVQKNDPRVTKVGRFIRRTSLDELPQLFNVLKGQLSLVGPRPHATKAKAAEQLYEHVVDGYFARHKVKPGITGWAQIHGWRGETDTEEKIERRVEYDLYYIDNWSLALDVYILARTPFALLNTKNAF